MPPKKNKSSKAKRTTRKSPKAKHTIRKSPKAKHTIRKSPKNKLCVVQTTAKYTSRPSPPKPANSCCGSISIGNDGNKWESRQLNSGQCRWFKI